MTLFTCQRQNYTSSILNTYFVISMSSFHFSFKINMTMRLSYRNRNLFRMFWLTYKLYIKETIWKQFQVKCCLYTDSTVYKRHFLVFACTLDILQFKYKIINHLLFINYEINKFRIASLGSLLHSVQCALYKKFSKLCRWIAFAYMQKRRGKSLRD